MGFILGSGSFLAATACIAWTSATLDPLDVVKKLEDMFCALNGATL
jgi:hypothetical protein